MLLRWTACAVCAAVLVVTGVASAQQRASVLPLPKQPKTVNPLEITSRDVAAGDADVHAVFLYEGASGRGFRPPVEAVPGMAPVPSVKVDVAATGKPVVLVLGAYNSVFWDVRVAAGARLSKVIAQGHYQQFLSELPTGTQAIVYREDPVVGVSPLLLSGDVRAFHDAFPALARLTGKAPTTVQAIYRGGEITVDGVSTISPPALDALVTDPGKVAFALPMGSGGTSSDGLSVSNCPRTTTYGTFKSNRAFASGKVYAELELKTPGPNQSAGEETNVGVMSLAPSPTGRLLAPASHLAGRGVPALDAGARRSLRNGSIVGLAIDLDAGRMHYSIDGRWSHGAPGSAGGLPLARGTPFVLTASLAPAETCPGDQWAVNFGAKPFRFAVPAGFVAYARGAEPISAYPLFADLPRITRWSFDPDKGWQDRFGGPLAASGGSAAPGATTTVGARPDRTVRSAEGQAPPATPCGTSPDYEVHAVGVYEGEGARHGPRVARKPGSVRIDVRHAETPICLVLIAYEPVEWLVVRAPAVKLVHVIATGYYPQTVSGVPDPSLVTLWPGPNGSDPRALSYNGDFVGSRDYADRLRRAAGKEARTFQHAYRASSFIIDGRTSGARRDGQRKLRTVTCGSSTIVCDPSDTVICSGRRIPCE